MTKYIAFVSGKGGVGKTTSTLNVGHALTALNKSTIVVDANLNTPNLSFHVGLINPEHNLHQFLRKKKALRDVIYNHESGLQIIPASPNYSERQGNPYTLLNKVFSQLEGTVDFVLVDSPSGLGEDVEAVLAHTDEVIVVVNPTLSSLMDALKTIHVAQAHDNFITGILVNMSYRGKNELKVGDIQKVLGYPLLAHVYMDKKVQKSLFKQTPLHYMKPRCRTSRQFKRVAEHLALLK